VKIHQHVTVFSQPGVFAAWPANRGLWRFDTDLMLGYSLAQWTDQNAPSDHCFDAAHGIHAAFARSGDDGETWVRSTPIIVQQNHGPIDFTDPGFGLAIFMARYTGGFSSYYFTTDYGSSWNGPHPFPGFGRAGVMARQDYVVNGKHDLSVFTTVLKGSGKEGVPLCVRTRDGGLSWSLEGRICEEPLLGFAIMPATVKCGGVGGYLSAVRFSNGQGESGIKIYRSYNQGKEWEWVSTPVWVKGRGNPPTLTKAADGKALVLCYGFRQEPCGVRAKVSTDYGKTWGEELLIRGDLPDWDCGYPRTILRRDGSFLTAYYANRRSEQRATIEATIWEL
jgi:hypothetical protein